MKITNIIACLILAVTAGSISFAEETHKKHENKTPINEKAAQGKVENNAAAAEGDISHEQAHELNKKDQKIEHAEQKNADLRNGHVSKGDHAKFNKKAKHVNAERKDIIHDNAEEKKAEEHANEHK